MMGLKTYRQKIKSFVVTGAAGFIGSQLVERLLQSHPDAAVIGIDSFHNFYSKAQKLKNLIHAKKQGRYYFFEASFEDDLVWQSISERFQVETVFHIAALAGVRPSIERPGEYYDHNVQRLVKLLEQMNQKQIPSLVFASSSSVYGGTKIRPFQESHTADKPLSPYAATKLAGEQLIHSYCHVHGIKAMCLRFFTVFGPRQRPDLAINKFVRNILINQPITLFGDGTTKRDYTFIEDILDGIEASFQRMAGQAEGHFDIFNLGAGRTIDLLTMVRTIEMVIGKKAEVLFEERHPADMELTFANVSKAANLLDYRPKIEFAQGVEEFYKWSLENSEANCFEVPHYGIAAGHDLMG